MHDSIITSVTDNFQAYLLSQDFSKQQELEMNMRTNGPSLFSIKENSLCSTELTRLFDLFYYMNGRLPLATSHLYIQDRDRPKEVGEEYINMKDPYEQYRGSRSHDEVSVPFLSSFNLFLGRKEKNSKATLTELYSNLIVGKLTGESDTSNFSALIEVCMEINIRLPNSTFTNK